MIITTASNLRTFASRRYKQAYGTRRQV